ncbi:MAG TPA: hypothetical protein VJP77_08055, partial [Planctomycetota bacterium]|nr:hypothetical protein [Planctomycetota bacterium]
LGPGTRARALRPLWGWRDFDADVWRSDLLPPLGWTKRSGEYRSSMFFPLYYWRSLPPEAPGGPRPAAWISLPIVLWNRDAAGAVSWGWFPVYGDLHPFLVYDRFRWVLFPLWLDTELAGTHYWNVVWPFFAWSSGSDTVHWRVWPLVGTDQQPGEFSRWFVAWPVGHFHRNRLDLPPGRRELKWFLFPLIGRTARGEYRSWTLLWPFLGVAWDSESGFVGVDAPWPVVRVQRGGLAPRADERTRFWPFFGHYVGQGLHADSYAWPILQRRLEDTPEYQRASFYVVPFWQQYELEWSSGDPGEGRKKLWPLWHTDRIGTWHRSAVLSLWPFRRMYAFDYYWAWLWEVWTWNRDGERTRRRSWLGLWKHEGDGYERRDSLAGLWSRRAYGADGARVRETSLLFGLL